MATAYCIRLLAGFKQRHGRSPQRQEWDELASDIAGKFKMPLDKKKLIEKKNRMKIDYEAWKYLQSQTGLGFNPITGAPQGDADFWQTFLTV